MFTEKNQIYVKLLLAMKLKKTIKEIYIFSNGHYKYSVCGRVVHRALNWAIGAAVY